MTRATAVRSIRTVENAAVTILIVAMVTIPLSEILLRRTLHIGVSGASLIVQHLALLVGMLGGMIAAREGRLLALSSIAETSLDGFARSSARISSAVGAVVSIFLAAAAWTFVDVEREVGKTLV